MVETIIIIAVSPEASQEIAIRVIIIAAIINVFATPGPIHQIEIAIVLLVTVNTVVVYITHLPLDVPNSWIL